MRRSRTAGALLRQRWRPHTRDRDRAHSRRCRSSASGAIHKPGSRDRGPPSFVVAVTGEVDLGGRRLLVGARLHFFASTPVVRIEITVHNPARAQHPGNYWELGDPVHPLQGIDRDAAVSSGKVASRSRVGASRRVVARLRLDDPDTSGIERRTAMGQPCPHEP